VAGVQLNQKIIGSLLEKFLTNSTPYYKKLFEKTYMGGQNLKKSKIFWRPLGASKCLQKNSFWVELQFRLIPRVLTNSTKRADFYLRQVRLLAY